VLVQHGLINITDKSLQVSVWEPSRCNWS